MKKKFLFRILFILFISFIFIFSCHSISNAAYPKLISRLLSAFENIKGYLIAMATPIAAIAIASGFLMQKFSFR